MLAPNYKTAKELVISDQLREALIKVLGMLERGELRHARHVFNYLDGGAANDVKGNCFNMAISFHEFECGTVGCYAGWASHLMGVHVDRIYHQMWCNPKLRSLFCPDIGGSEITAEAGAKTLRHYLTTGEVVWG